MIADGAPITHERLDAVEPRPAVVALRQMLVHVGALPPRNEALERLPAWLTRTLTTVPKHHRQVINVYGTWAVLRRARQRAARTQFTTASAGRARGKVRMAVTFLHWLDAQGVELEHVRQTHLDRWLAAGSPNRQCIGDFLRWTHQRGLTAALCVPRPAREEPDLSMTDEQRWELLRRCLHDCTLPLDVRAAGALLLLYGLPVSRIAVLRHEDLVTSGGKPCLLIAGHQTQLPPAVDSLLRAATAAKTRSAVGRAVNRDRWLFPSSLPGRPISAEGLGNKLNRHGIPVRASRNAALVTLGSELPAAALSALLGISISSAVQWTHRAKRDWHTFIQAREIVTP